MTKPLSYPGLRHFKACMLNHISWEELVRPIRWNANYEEIHKAMGSQATDCRLKGKIPSESKAILKGMGRQGITHSK